MCPACIASTAVMVAGAGSTGGILAVCVGKFRRFSERTSRCQTTKDSVTSKGEHKNGTQ